MNKPAFYLLLLPVIFFLSCQTQGGEPSSNSGEIVLIFQEPKVEAKSGRIGAPFFTDKCKITYWDMDGIAQSYVPDSSAFFDTLSIATDRPSLEVAHYFRTYDVFTFQFQIGDTVLFTYPNATPHAMVLTREVDPTAVNYDAIWRKQLEQPFPAHRKNVIEEIITQIDAGHDLKTLLAEEEKIQAGIQLAAQQELKNELGFLDSLKEGGILSEEAFQYRKLNARLALKKKEVEIALQAYKGLMTEENIQPEHVNIETTVDGIKMPLIDNVLSREYEGLLENNSYRELMDVYFYFMGRKVSWISEEVSYNGKPGGGFRHADYSAKYDTIANSPLFSEKVRQYFLRKELENIIEYMPLADKEIYLNKFEETYHDSASIQYLQQKFAFGLLDTEAKNDLRLVSYSGKELSYQDLLQKHDSSVVYVDFWSTGCRPCLQEMPESDKLKLILEKENVVFVHISLEPNEGNWKKGCEKFNLLGESYLIKNKFTSAEFEKMGIDWIPHYLIYDRNGKLVEPFAPRPSEERALTVLRTYL